MEIDKEQNEEEIEEENEEEAITVEENVKDLKLILNTGSTGEVIHETQKVNGRLNAIIVDAEKPVDVTISLAEFPDIQILSARNIIGQKYIHIADQSVTPQFEKLTFASKDFYLNDKLNINIKNNINTVVTVVIRHT